MLTLITFLIVLSILVFAHELGHFFVARKFGVKAEEFGFGFPPRAFGFYKNKKSRWQYIFGAKEVGDASDTIFSINWIPLGGFVKIKGEDGPSASLGQVEDKDSFASRKIWQRASILSAGVTMNIVLAAILISIGLMIGFPQTLDNVNPRAAISERKIQVIDILPDSPAAKADVKAGDAIISINGIQFNNQEELQNYVNENNGRDLAYKIKRGANELTKNIAPITIEETGKGGIGIGIVETGIVKYPFFTAIWEGIKATCFLTWAIITAFYHLIKSLILGQGLIGDLAGPVGIASMTGQVARMGFVYILQFTALLSINLAIINFLPIPALDGGRVLFLIIEKIKGSPIKRELEAIIHRIGFALLMLLILIVTFRDVAKFGDKFKMIWERIIN